MLDVVEDIRSGTGSNSPSIIIDKSTTGTGSLLFRNAGNITQPTGDFRHVNVLGASANFNALNDFLYLTPENTFEIWFYKKGIGHL